MWDLDYKEGWVPKNWCFWTVVLEKTLESPLDCRRSNQSILKDLSPRCSLEGLMLKLKLQYFGHLMRTADSFEKTLMLERLRAGGAGDDRGWDGWMASPTQWTWVWENSGSWWWTGRSGVLQFTGSQRDRQDWVTELNWGVTWYVLENLPPGSCTAQTYPIKYNHRQLSTTILLRGSLVKNLPAMQETQVPSLGWKNPLEKEMAVHSSILARKIPWTEESGRLQSMGSRELGMT